MVAGGTGLRIMMEAAKSRRSWIVYPSTPTSAHALFHALVRRWSGSNCPPLGPVKSQSSSRLPLALRLRISATCGGTSSTWMLALVLAGPSSPYSPVLLLRLVALRSEEHTSELQSRENLV